MTDESLDRDLRQRLDRLARAVPVEPTATAVTSGLATTRPVNGSTGVRSRLSIGGLGIAAAVAAVVVSLVGIGLALQRPGVGRLGDGVEPVVATVRDGDFELTLRAPKGRYDSGAVIDGVTATLTYTGGSPKVVVWGAGSLLGFGLRNADLTHVFDPAYRLSCVRYELAAGVPFVAPFAKSGGYTAEDPAYAWDSAFFGDADLRLDPGTWTITAEAPFGTAGCNEGNRVLRAEIQVEVGSITAPASPASLPATVDGLIVRTVSQVLAGRASGAIKGEAVAVGGFWSDGSIAHSCSPPLQPPGDLQMRCHGNEFGITELDEPIFVVDRHGFATEAKGPHLSPFLSTDLARVHELFSLPIINGQRYPPIPIVVIGHFDDPRAADCWPDQLQLCLDRLVVDRIVVFDIGAVPTPAVSPSPTPFPSPWPGPMFPPESCEGEIAYSFVGWTTTQELDMAFQREGHVFAMVTAEPVLLTEDGWQPDPNGSGHTFQIWGRRICLSEEGQFGSLEFSAVNGSTYVLWDDGLRVPGENPLRP